jgi:hypothetical protein
MTETMILPSGAVVVPEGEGWYVVKTNPGTKVSQAVLSEDDLRALADRFGE